MKDLLKPQNSNLDLLSSFRSSNAIEKEEHLTRLRNKTNDIKINKPKEANRRVALYYKSLEERKKGMHDRVDNKLNQLRKERELKLLLRRKTDGGKKEENY